MKSMKTDKLSPEFKRFDAAIGKLLAVPREVYQARLAEWKASPGSRGPKRKVKPDASPGPVDLPRD